MSIEEVYSVVGLIAVIALFAGCMVALLGVALYGEEDEKEKYKNEG